MIKFTKKVTLKHFSRILFKNFRGLVLQNTSLYICKVKNKDSTEVVIHRCAVEMLFWQTSQENSWDQVISSNVLAVGLQLQ